MWGTLQSADKDSLISAPQKCNGFPRIKSIACGHFHNLCQDEDGQLYQWGLRPDSLGGGLVNKLIKVRNLPKGRESGKLIGAMNKSAFVTSEGEAFAWDWKSMTADILPELVDKHVVDLAFGWKHTAALVEEN